MRTRVAGQVINPSINCLPWWFACTKGNENDLHDLSKRASKFNWSFFGVHMLMVLSSASVAIAPFTLKWLDKENPSSKDVAKSYLVYIALVTASDLLGKWGEYIIDQIASDATNDAIVPWMYMSSSRGGCWYQAMKFPPSSDNLEMVRSGEKVIFEFVSPSWFIHYLNKQGQYSKDQIQGFQGEIQAINDSFGQQNTIILDGETLVGAKNIANTFEYRVTRDAPPDDLLSQLNEFKNVFKFFLLNCNTVAGYKFAQIIAATVIVFTIFDNYGYGAIFLAYAVGALLLSLAEHVWKKDANKNLNEAYGRCTQEQIEYILNNDLVVSYNLYKSASARVVQLREEIRVREDAVASIERTFSVMSLLALRAAQFGVLFFTARDVLDDNKDFDSEDLANMLIYFQLLLGPTEQLSNILRNYTKKRSLISGIHKYITRRSQIDEGMELPGRQGGLAIRFENVSCRNVLSNINFEITPGEVVAIIGPSNAGKSTLVKLMLGMCDYHSSDASAAKVLINGIDVKNLKISSLRNYVTIVPQSTQLFETKTLKENMCISSSRSNQDVSWSMLDRCGLAHLEPDPQNRNQPPVLNVEVGNLSGGEKQKVGVARAKYRLDNTKLLIFDEPTASLDPINSRFIWDELSNIARETGATVLYITHDQSIAKRADKVLVVHDKSVEVCSGHGKGSSIDQNVKYQEMRRARSYDSFFWRNPDLPVGEAPRWGKKNRKR